VQQKADQPTGLGFWDFKSEISDSQVW